MNFTTTAGNTATNARNIDPGKVIWDIIASSKFDVSVPGLIPGIKPPLLFKSSAILLVGTVKEDALIKKANDIAWKKKNVLEVANYIVIGKNDLVDYIKDNDHEGE